MKRVSPHSKLGILALLVALVSCCGSFAPFTPAVFLVLVSVPFAVLALVSGSWRLGVAALYWSGASVVFFPTVMPSSHDYLILVILGGGLVLGVTLAADYVRARAV